MRRSRSSWPYAPAGRCADMAPLDATQKMAYDFAQDLVKQLITLATAIIALSITFLKDFATDSPPAARNLLAISWIAYILVVFFGIWALMAMTGSLAKDGISINEANMRLPAMLQIVAFVVALGLTIAAGWWAL